MSIHDDMLLDMDAFDFSMIADEDAPQEKAPAPVQQEEAYEDDDFSWEQDSDEDEEVVEEDDGEDHDFDPSDFDSSFSLLPDEYEIAIGDVKIAKKDLAQVVTAKDDILNTQRALDTFCASMMTRQTAVETAMAVAKTEVEKQMDYVNSILDDDDASPEQIAQAHRAKRQLRAREQELKAQASAAEEALFAQKQQAIQYAVDATARQIPGGKKAVQQAVQYATGLGVNGDALAQSISPALVNMVLDAMRWNNMQKDNSKRVSNAAKAKAPTSATPKKNVTRQEASRKAAIVNKMKRGEITGADAFAYIQD